jgi:hypothetical protein
MSNFLPSTPGRERRLAYGNYIRNIHMNRNIDNNYNIVNIDNIGRGMVDIVIRNNRNNKNGILLNELIMKSNIYFTKDIFLCSICLNEKNDNIIRRLICNHDFHINCIDLWLSCNKTCPICRLELSDTFTNAI